MTLWKRIEDQGDISPLDVNDKVDIVVINTPCNGQLGNFVFPKSVLLAKGIFSKNIKEGKRGFRLYPPWDKTSSKQASKTQAWQLDYFLPYGETLDINRAKKLYLQE